MIRSPGFRCGSLACVAQQAQTPACWGVKSWQNAVNRCPMRSCDRETARPLRRSESISLGCVGGVDEDKAAADNARHAREQTGYADR